MFNNQNSISITLNDDQFKWLDGAIERVRNKTSRHVSRSEVLIMLFADGVETFDSKFPKEKPTLRIIK